MNKAQTPGYIMMVLASVSMVASTIIALSCGENPSHSDILTVIIIFGMGETLTIGYFLVLLWDRLNMLTDLYVVLTGDNQTEIAGTLQRLRNTVMQGIKNIRDNL